MKRLKLDFKEKSLCELVLWNCVNEKIENYDFKVETRGYMSKTHYVFTFKKKKRLGI